MEKLNQPIDLVNQCIIVLLRTNDRSAIKKICDIFNIIPKYNCYNIAYGKLPYIRELKLVTVLFRYQQMIELDAWCDGINCDSDDCRCGEQMKLQKIFKLANVLEFPNISYYYVLQKYTGNMLYSYSDYNIHDNVMDFSNFSVQIGKIIIKRCTNARPEDYPSYEIAYNDSYVRRNIKIWYWKEDDSPYNYKTNAINIINSVYYDIYGVCEDCRKVLHENEMNITCKEPTCLSKGCYLQCCSKCAIKYYGNCEWCGRTLNHLDDGLCAKCV